MNHENCHIDLIEKPLESELPEGLTEAQLLVTGMGCTNCAARVHNSLVQLDGVYKAEVLLESGMARVLYDSKRVKPAGFPQAIELVGRQSHHNYAAQLIS